MAKFKIFYKINKAKFEEALKKEGITQSDLYRACGTQPTVICGLKSGYRNCTDKTVKKILGGFKTKYKILDIFEVDHVAHKIKLSLADYERLIAEEAVGG